MTTMDRKLSDNGKKPLMQSELQLLLLVMNSIPQAVFWKDRNLVYLGCNQAFADDAGFSSPDEIIGKTDFDMPWKAQAELYRSDDQLVMENGKAKLNYEEPQTTPDGSTTWLNTSKIPVHENGQVVAILGMYEDITERKQIETLLRDSEARYSAVIKQAHEGVVIIQDNVLRFVNDTMANMLGFTPAEMENTSMINYIASESRELVVNRIKARLAGEDVPTVYEAKLQKKDGTLIDAELSAGVIEYQGRPADVGVIRDITVRKRELDELQASRERAANIIDFLPDATFVTDQERRVIAWNRAIEEMTGVKKEDILGKGDFAYAVPFYGDARPMLLDSALDKSQVPDRYNSVKKQSNTISAEIYVPSVYNGRGAYLFVTASTLYNSNGEIVGAIEAIRDITENKKLEREVQEAFKRRGQQVQISTQVSQSIASATNLEDLYERVVTQVKEEFGYYHTQLLRYDEFQNAVVLITGYGETGAKMLAQRHQMPMGEGLIGTAAATGETVLRPALENDPDWHPNPLLPNTKGEVAVPIKLGDRVLGVLDVQSSVANALGPDDQLLLEGLCGQIASAIEGTRLRQEMTEQIEEIHRLNRAMSQDGWKAYRETASLPMGLVFDQAEVKTVTENSLAEDLFAKVPLTLPGGNVIGTVAVANDPSNPISSDDQEFLQQISEQVALALESARLFEQTQMALQDAKEAEKVIRNSEAKLSEALNIAKLGHWEYDLERGVFTFNDQFYSIFHTTAKQVGGYELSSEDYARLFVHPEDAPLVGKEIERALASTDRHFAAKTEHRVIFPDGGIGYISVDINLERDENGKIIRWYGANQDITERKLAELAVRASEARLAEALEIAKLANWEYDVERDRFLFNDQFYSIFHTTAEKMGGYEISSAEYAQHLVHPDDVPVVGIAIEKALASTDKYYSAQLEHRVVYSDGGIGYVSVEVHIERDDQGKIIRYYGANQDITERKMAELAVAESERRLQDILDTLPVAIAISRLSDGILLYHNPAFTALVGYTEEGLTGKRTPDFYYNPDDRAKLFKDLGERGSLDNYELKVKHSDGHLIWTLLNVFPAQFGGENSIVLGAVDVTRRKQIEESLAKRADELTVLNRVMEVANSSVDLQYILQTATDEFRTLLQAHSAGVLLLDKKGENLILTTESYADPNMPKLAGRAMPIASNPATDKSIKSGDTVLVPNAQTDPILKPIHAIMKQRNIQSVLVTPLYSRDKIIGVFSIDTNDPTRHFDDSDITLIETLAKQLASAIESAQLFEETRHRAADLSTVAVVSTTTSTVLDPDELLNAVVNITKERFGLYHAHIYLTNDESDYLDLTAGAGEVGRQMLETGFKIDMGAERSLVARAARERQAIIINDVHDEIGFLPNPLLPNTQSEMAVPMLVGDRVLGVFDVQSDKVGDFTSEDANIYTTLASQVAIALQNARLYVEQAATVTQLRELDRLKSAFLANMSHELRTPLNSILGFTDVMLEGLDGDLTEYMDNDLRLIQKNGRHLLHLINDVLDMAKIESGRMNLHPETFRIHELLEEVTSITAPLASEKNLSLFIDPDSDADVQIYADNTRLRQVMINLVNNSIKFTEKGKISLFVKPIDGARVLIAVKDTGIGIPQDHLEAVFQEFTQVDTSTTRKAGGTGLGLPISRRLIEMHGGRLWAESTGVSGEGSTFFVEMPLEAHVADVIEKQEK